MSDAQCRHCQDPVAFVWQCPTCQSAVVLQCYECHNELAHGQLPDLADSRYGSADPHYIHDRQYHGENSGDNR